MKNPLVFLPGMMCDARLFWPQIEAFSSHTPVMVMPQAGHESIADLTRTLLTHMPPQFILAGLSMGGIVAMEVIRQAPDRVTGLILMDTNPLSETYDRQEVRTDQIARVKAGGTTALQTIMRDEMKPHYLAQTSRRSEILDLCMTMARDLGPQVFIDQSLMLQSRPDQCDTLRSIQVPTLLLCGAEDTLCPLMRHEMMHDLIPGSDLTIIENAGHLPTLENSAQVNAVIKNLLSKK